MKFLEQPWFDAVNAQIQADGVLQTTTAGLKLGIQQHVFDTPSGEDILHYFKADHGQVEVGLGELPDADATMKADYASASAMNRGELDAMGAFSSGKMMVTGNMAVLMSHQGVLTQLNTAFEAVRDQTTYDD